MAHRPAPALVLFDGDEARLEAMARSRVLEAGLARRAQIVLAGARGEANCLVAGRLGCSVNTVKLWRSRYLAGGIAALVDKPKSGRPRSVDRARVLVATLKPPPKSWGITHWSTRSLGRRLGVSNATVADVWAEYGVQPWRSGTFKFSTDPELEAKVVDVVGLYLNPPENAVVLSVDEKSQIQALDRTAPILPMTPGKIERRTSDYVRHGTTTLYAALNTATGQVTSSLKPRHRHEEFLSFLRQVARAHPDGDLHLICDNYATHKHQDVKAWLAANPRVTMHFTPTSGSWLNMVEAFFGLVQRHALNRGVFKSVQQLNQAIRRYIAHHNAGCKPFKWTKDASTILAKIDAAKANTYLSQTTLTHH